MCSHGTTTMTSPSEVIALRAGPTVALAALRVLWQLEARGFSFEVREDRLYVTPRDQLTPIDEADIRTYRDELCALVRHCEGIQ
jgi:hypothetical protein